MSNSRSHLSRFCNTSYEKRKFGIYQYHSNILSIKGISLIINTSKCKNHFTFTSNTLSLPAYINIVVFHETKQYQSHHQSSGTWGTHFPLQLYRPAHAKNGGIYCEICRSSFVHYYLATGGQYKCKVNVGICNTTFY